MFGAKKADYSKLRSNLKQAMARMKMLTKKRSELSVKKRREIADMLSAAKVDQARIQVEHTIREDFFVEVVDIVEMMCDLLLARFGLIENMNNVDQGLEAAIESIIWVAGRLKGDIPELKTVAKQLAAKYGKSYADKCRENGFGHVNKKVIDKLDVAAPSSILVEKYLIEIAQTYNVPFEPDLSRMQVKPAAKDEGISISAPIPIVVSSEDELPETNGAVGSMPPANETLSPAKLTPEKRKPGVVSHSPGHSAEKGGSPGSSSPNMGTGSKGIGGQEKKGLSLGMDAGRVGANGDKLPEKCGLPQPQFNQGQVPHSSIALHHEQQDDILGPPPPYTPPAGPLVTGVQTARLPPPLPKTGPNANTLSRSAKNPSSSTEPSPTPIPPRPCRAKRPSPSPQSKTTSLSADASFTSNEPSPQPVPPRPASATDVSPSRPEKSPSSLGMDYSARQDSSLSSNEPSPKPIPPRPVCARNVSPSRPEKSPSSLGADYSARQDSSFSSNEPSPKPIPPRPVCARNVSPSRPEKSPSSLGTDYSARQDLSFSSNEPSPRPIPPRPASVGNKSLSPGDSGRCSLSPNYQDSSLSSNDASPRIPPRPTQSRRSTESINRDVLLPGFPELPDCSDLPDITNEPGQRNSSTDDVDDLTRRFNALRNNK